MAPKISGILFDLGDTLLDFGDPSIPALFRAGARLSYDYLRLLGQPMPSFGFYNRRQWWAIHWRYFLSRVTGREFNSLDVSARLGKRMGHNLTRQQSLELSWQWYTPLRQVATVEAGVHDTLRSFAAAGLTVGLVSNTFIPGQVLDRHLELENLLDLLPIRIYSSDVGYRKPRPEIFKLALQRCGLEAGQTLFVGDSPSADVRGAKRAGMISVLRDPAGRYDRRRVKPHHRIRHIAELPEIVASYNDA